MSSGGGLTVSIVLPSVFPVLTNEIDRNDLRAADSSATLRDMSATLRTIFRSLVPDSLLLRRLVKEQGTWKVFKAIIRNGSRQLHFHHLSFSLEHLQLSFTSFSSTTFSGTTFSGANFTDRQCGRI